MIDAAAAIFSRHGYHGASTRAIADQLQIKVASLYFHIASKDDALEEICTLGNRRALLYLERALSEPTHLAEQLRIFFRHQRDDVVAHADYVSVLMHEGRHLPAPAKARVAALTREFRSRIDRMFEAAEQRGELNDGMSPRHARFVLIGTVRSISELYTSGHVSNIDEITASWTEAVIRGLVRNYTPPVPVNM